MKGVTKEVRKGCDKQLKCFISTMNNNTADMEQAATTTPAEQTYKGNTIYVEPNNTPVQPNFAGPVP